MFLELNEVVSSTSLCAFVGDNILLEIFLLYFNNFILSFSGGGSGKFLTC